MRAVMHGFVSQFYKVAVIPSHIKPAFKEHNILTVQSIIAKNALMVMSRIVRFNSDIPPSIRNLHRQIHQATALYVYGTPNYRNTVCFKGPLLQNDFSNACPLIFSACKTVSSYKTHAIKFLLQKQACGSSTEWDAQNNILTMISGPQKLTQARQIKT